MNPDLSRRLLADMIRVRRFEEKCAELYAAGKIRGFLHLYIGEEACAAGVLHQARPEDSIVSTYREHGHALLRGVSAGSLLAEMYGKAEGCARGRGGSMHLFDAGTRFFGGNAIVGGGLPIAVGLALADRITSRPGITICFLGDGAAAEGAFYESLNLAALWNLPVLFVCENNLYAMGTALSRAQARTDLGAKAAACGVPSSSADGMEVEAVDEAAREAMEIVRDGRPRFLELRTYRFRPHSMYDPELYRTKEEVAAWKRRDPIVSFTARLRQEGRLTDADLEALERAARAEIAAAVDFAERGSWEPVEDLMKDIGGGPPC